MKHLLAFFLLISVVNSFCQTQFTNVPLETAKEVKDAEPFVLEACEIILSTPTGESTPQSTMAQLFILTWMERTEYSFMLTSNMMKCCKKDDLTGIYLAALAKGRLGYDENFEENAIKEFIKYVSNPDMGIKQTGPIKKLIAADQNGELSHYTSE